MNKIDKAVITAINIANNEKHGYDQTNRNGPDYDCSSFLAYCLNTAGFPVSLSSWTGNIRKQLISCGFKSIAVNGTRKRGDIFLTEGKHIVMCTSSNEIVHASINEFGKTTGGKTGDQSGKEICERSFYTPDYGWDYHLRYEPTENDKTTLKRVTAKYGARYFDKTIAGLYRVTASVLNVRNGAGQKHGVIVKIPADTAVRNYGYYSLSVGVKWLYVQFVYNGTEYIGFCSSDYLEKV